MLKGAFTKCSYMYTIVDRLWNGEVFLVLLADRVYSLDPLSEASQYTHVPPIVFRGNTNIKARPVPLLISVLQCLLSCQITVI